MRRLLIFVKYPTPGQVKTRLAASVGDDAASGIARLCAELTLERLASWRRETVLCVHPPDTLARARAWLGSEWSLQPQEGATLGERLAQAVGHAFAQGATRVVAIGTDSPWLEPHDVETAFDVLERVPVTIGPTEDGGYYLIGLSQPVPYLFEGIPWSTAAVYQETITKARALGLRVHALPLGYDVDRLEDVSRFVADERARGTHVDALDTIEASVHTMTSPQSIVHSP